MKKNILVSVIIPTYNRASLIKDTLESVLFQTYDNWECIIIDDNSTDETFKIVNEYIKKDNRFKFIQKKITDNRGASKSRNTGLTIAKGDFIQFLDSDDILAKNKIEAQLELLDKESDFTLSACKWGKFNSVGEQFDFFENKSDYKTFENGKEYFDLIGAHGGFYPSHCFLIPKFLIFKAGFWNESLTINDDGEFFFRILISADKLVFSSKTHVLYREHTVNNLSVLDSDSKANSLLNSWKIIEALYQTKYNEKKPAYLLKKKTAVYNELKKNNIKQINANKQFFREQIRNDNFILKLNKLGRRIRNKFKKIILK